MSEQDYQEFLKALERVRAQHATPEKARELLIKEGVLTESGELAPPYRPED
jgi:hypothetical protein